MITVEGWVIEVCQDRFSDLLLSYHTGHTYIRRKDTERLMILKKQRYTRLRNVRLMLWKS